MEQVANQATGFAISYPINLVLLPAFGMKAGAGKAFIITLVFTAISMIRGYILRRVFNYLHLRREIHLMSQPPSPIEEFLANLPIPPVPEDPREAAIHADVFRPDETDMDYFLRRKRELESRNPTEA